MGKHANQGPPWANTQSPVLHWPLHFPGTIELTCLQPEAQGCAEPRASIAGRSQRRQARGTAPRLSGRRVNQA
eukprot:16450335-Heterocapsa_arctica.AAC.1